MEKTPFSVFDFLAFLSSGSIMVLLVDHIFGLGLVMRTSIPPVFGVELVLSAYVAGHVVSQLSAAVFEHLVVFRFLERPSLALLGRAKRASRLRFVFPGYYALLPEKTRTRIEEQALARKHDGKGDDLFLHAYSVTTAAADGVQDRLDTFRTQYNFARNMSFSLMLAGVTLPISDFSNHLHPAWKWSALALLTAIVMFYRYIKFLRQYSYELFIRYAELASDS